MSRLSRVLLLALAVLMTVPAAATADPGKGKNPATTTSTRTVECDGGVVTFTGPDEMWPPNHKLEDASLTFTPDEDTESYSYMAMAGHDQVVDGEEMNGSGNTPFETDFAFVGEDGSTSQAAMGMETDEVTLPMQIRAERSGQDRDGRTYTLSGMVTFTDGDMMDMACEFEFTVLVPHDQGKRAGGPKAGLATLAGR